MQNASNETASDSEFRLWKKPFENDVGKDPKMNELD